MRETRRGLRFALQRAKRDRLPLKVYSRGHEINAMPLGDAGFEPLRSDFEKLIQSEFVDPDEPRMKLPVEKYGGFLPGWSRPSWKTLWDDKNEHVRWFKIVRPITAMEDDDDDDQDDEDQQGPGGGGPGGNKKGKPGAKPQRKQPGKQGKHFPLPSYVFFLGAKARTDSPPLGRGQPMQSPWDRLGEAEQRRRIERLQHRFKPHHISVQDATERLKAARGDVNKAHDGYKIVDEIHVSPNSKSANDGSNAGSVPPKDPSPAVARGE